MRSELCDWADPWLPGVEGGQVRVNQEKMAAGPDGDHCTGHPSTCSEAHVYPNPITSPAASPALPSPPCHPARLSSPLAAPLTPTPHSPLLAGARAHTSEPLTMPIRMFLKNCAGAEGWGQGGGGCIVSQRPWAGACTALRHLRVAAAPPPPLRARARALPRSLAVRRSPAWATGPPR